MSRRKLVPSYRHHKQSGQALVTLTDGLGGRKDVLLGKYDSEQSYEAYQRVLAEWQRAGRQLVQQATSGLSVNELILAYWPQVEEYYRHPDGKATSEVANIKLALRWLRQLYGHTRAADFKGVALEALRGKMIEAGLCRNRINKDISRIRRMFRWGASKELVPVEVHQLLMTVEGLKAGRSAARETKPVRPVPVAFVESTLPDLSPQLQAMVKIQLHTGMRPGEVCVMRTIDVDTTGAVWLYRPGSDQGAHGKHKTAHRGQDRVIAIGPKGQEVLKPWLRLKLDEYLFQPREARAYFDEQRKANRKSKVTPSQAARTRKAKPKKAPGLFYCTSAYDSAIQKACERAGVPPWRPNQLRHAAATRIRKEAGLDASRAILGHKSPQVTELYAEMDLGQARAVIAKIV
jgi:integrase